MVNSRDLRISVLREQPPQPDGEWVVYCMTASRRLHHNYGLDRAVYWAKELGKPLLVFLISPNQMTDVLTVIAEVTRFNLPLYPAILLLSQGDCFPVHTHVLAPYDSCRMTLSYHEAGL